MIKNKLLYLSMVIIFLSLISTSVYAQEDMVEIDNSVFENPRRTPSIFRHDEHNEKAEIEECNACHHIYKDGRIIEDESSEDQQCSDCHKLKAFGDTPSLMKAFHNNCTGCHKQKKNGPIMCGECHLWGKNKIF